MDFIEFISQDLPWDDIDRALGDPGQAADPPRPAPTTCSSPAAEDEFHADDLSLFSAFASSLPPLGPQADCDTDIKAIRSSLDRSAAAGTDLAQDTAETDLDCSLEGVGLSSGMEDIMADILDSSGGEKLAKSSDENESRNRSTLLSADNDASALAKKSKLASDMKSPTERCSVNGTTDERATNSENRAVPCHDEMAPEVTSFLSEQNQADGIVTESGEGLDSNDDDDDDDGLTDSQRWVCDDLRTYLTQQHDEASRINRMRDLRPPATSAVAPDRISRAIHVFATENRLIELDLQLVGALRSTSSDPSRCCQLLDDYCPYELSPRVLVQYPFVAGTLELCCRWAGDHADELHSAAHRLRAFMMAMFARDSVDERFLAVLTRQVSACRRAVSAKTPVLTKLARKHRELTGLAKFYSRLYSDWDSFMTQFCGDSNHQPICALNTGRRLQRSVRPRKTGSGGQQAAGAENSTEDHVVTRSTTNQPTAASNDDRALAAEIVTASPRSASKLGDVESTSDVANVSLIMKWLRSAAAAGPQSSLDDDIKPFFDEATVKHTMSRCGRRRPAGIIDNTGCVQSLAEDIKPAAGLLAEKRHASRRNSSRDHLQVDHGSGTEVDDFRQQSRKRRVDEADVNAGNDISGRGLQSGQVDNSDVINTAKSGEKDGKAKRARRGENTGTKDSVEVVGEIAWTEFEEQDVKPDLSALDVTVQSGCPRKDYEGIKQVGDAMRRSRKGKRRPKRSRRAKIGRKSGVEVAGAVPLAGFETEQDVKPDLSSLAVAVERKICRRTKRMWSLCPSVVTRNMDRARQLLNTAATQPRPPAVSHASPPRCPPHSPPFTLLSPSKIKVEVET